MREDKDAELPTFLNHHYPASDIPKQARELYVRNVVRVIPDVITLSSRWYRKFVQQRVVLWI
jgi:two-component system, chemotaxis family, sensor kinase Cph1